jgi:hypothetical protein
LATIPCNPDNAILQHHHSFFDLLRICLYVTDARYVIKLVVTTRARIIWSIGEKCLDELMDLVLLPGPDAHLKKRSCQWNCRKNGHLPG